MGNDGEGHKMEDPAHIIPGRLPAGFASAIKDAALQLQLVPAAATRVRSVFVAEEDEY
jgi:hypothetical protein